MPSSSGISMSSVTMSGSSAWICLSASRPLRAVPTTRKPSVSSISSLISLRMNALSSTTRTPCFLEDPLTVLEGAHVDAPVRQVEVDAPSEVAADVLAAQRDAGALEGVPRGEDVPLADVDRVRGEQRAEHARPADDLRD